MTALLREREQFGLENLSTKGDLETLKNELKAEIRAAVADTQSAMIKRFAGVMVAQDLGIVVATVTISRLLASGGQP